MAACKRGWYGGASIVAAASRTARVQAAAGDASAGVWAAGVRWSIHCMLSMSYSITGVLFCATIVVNLLA
jgi:hypothetical protein